MLSANQIVMILKGTIIILFVTPILFTRKGIASGFKLIDEDKKRLIVSSRNKIILFYVSSALFLAAMWRLEIIIESVDIDVKLYNILTISFVILALICYVLSLASLFVWCRIKCMKRWPWILSFFIGTVTIIPNFYLLFKIARNSKSGALNKRG